MPSVVMITNLVEGKKTKATANTDGSDSGVSVHLLFAAKYLHDCMLLVYICIYSTLRGRIKGTASAALVIQNRF